MNAIEFETKYLNRLVRYRGEHYQIPTDVTYWVTAALFEHDENGITIFAIMSEKWNPPNNVDWFTFKLAPEELAELGKFEIVGEFDASSLNEVIRQRLLPKSS